jgi:hypothetical protein
MRNDHATEPKVHAISILRSNDGCFHACKRGMIRAYQRQGVHVLTCMLAIESSTGTQSSHAVGNTRCLRTSMRNDHATESKARAISILRSNDGCFHASEIVLNIAPLNKCTLVDMNQLV